MVEELVLRTADGLALEAELCVPSEPWGAAVLAHPHPLHGGDMRSIVVGALFAGLPALGVAVLRFNFRGVGRSEGSHDHGDADRADIVAGIDALYPIVEGLPLVVAGWSFGADTALGVADERLAGWFCVAPPLRDRAVALMAPVATDSRPKLLAVPEHDQFRPPASLAPLVVGWTATTVSTVAGADHFLVGRTDRAIGLCEGFLRELAIA